MRKYGEVFANAVSSVAAALDYPKELIKDSVRPDYWVKDSEAPSCHICVQVFVFNVDDMEQSKLRLLNGSTQNSSGHTIDVRRHHCRSCGNAVCYKCSMNRAHVPERGWNNLVRVCDNCYQSKS